MKDLFQALGFAGAAINAFGYLPQIVHLTRERFSAGVSTKAWGIWLLSSVLIFSHAFEVFDLVFITLQSVNIAAIVLIISWAKRYRGMACALHKDRHGIPASEFR